jgi:hypothetical protein
VNDALCHGCPARALCLIRARFADPLNVCFCVRCGTALVTEPEFIVVRGRPRARTSDLKIIPVKMNCAEFLKEHATVKTHFDGKCPACAQSHWLDVGGTAQDWKKQFMVFITPEDR